MISVFDLFKIGVGPSSSHTVGPMVAGKRFRDALPEGTRHVTAELFGSLAWTGKGHATDRAVCLGLLGAAPASLDPDDVSVMIARLAIEKAIDTPDGGRAAFDPERDLIFDFKTMMPFHTNALRLRAFAADGGLLVERLFYSIGGGFVVEEGETADATVDSVPYVYNCAADLLALCHRTDLTIAEVQMANECALRPRADVEAGLDAIVTAMFGCIDRGLSTGGSLPGRLRVRRRAKDIREQLEADRARNQRPPHEIMDWVSVYAIAVNEENAAGGRVVTAPTNGAAGIVPAVLRYARDFCQGIGPADLRTFLLTAAAVGALIKRNASISGAEVGCQGEVGSAASMAAAGLASVLGASPEQVENAAEIAMEHHLGMTCDPIGGLVQIPCIERNAFGANKAIAAASLALRGDGVHAVSLDQVIETMRQTGLDMQSKYKETSQGGLAVNVPEC
ncbi:L-serine ammonia-lyase [Azorhizobium oxalatiphilum]|uniref:L-serine dehydratase n=1 Tax=Azorhizobium oxalatiphilum TaxID=980631 RepID=A0A917FGX2_9HYPH|nr:L-serine ammonia-lyase [Azorhizobium oxalatiphilum]GGF81941.1 L-serine ammonia-lyase [Azorhizobium oxalatiphilum]